MSIISLFSCVVPSLTKQSYNDFESVHSTAGIRGSFNVSIIFWSVVRRAIALSKPLTMPYNSLASTLRVTRLHLLEFQCTILPLISKSKFVISFVRVSTASTIRKPSWEDMSVLFAKEPSVKINSFVRQKSRGINVSPLVALFFCHLIRLFNASMSCGCGSVIWAATARSYAASGWHTLLIYAPRAR